ncbi:hypothetical protein [Paraburkholderia sp. MM5384-R2]|uniref:hypothetical protein n=1 Tax=Paraburkholderia sp. MM5384-R2 TaxID=2723097 RepID=UPI0016181436|nr:hypothetical protein [Paraburkholderia sp. MM5384-R2]MBB5497572.1 hypothetical protein [Paraburkholderia sp. MM5384-R2]
MAVVNVACFHGRSKAPARRWQGADAYKTIERFRRKARRRFGRGVEKDTKLLALSAEGTILLELLASNFVPDGRGSRQFSAGQW